MPVTHPQTDLDAARVTVSGRATVFNGNVAAARQAALQVAYARAVARGTGSGIDRLTLQQHMRAVTEVVQSRGRGFVKRYEVVGESLVSGDVPEYEVNIRADLATSMPSEGEQIAGLQAFLEVIGTPKLLILLAEADVGRGDTQQAPARPEEPEGRIRMAETAAAATFRRVGYQVITSDDLTSGNSISPEQLSRARKGITADATAVARATEADMLITGVLRSSTQRVTPQGVEFISVTTDVSAKALVVTNGYVIDVFRETITKANVSAIGATAATFEAVAERLSRKLAWTIPSILAARPRVMHLKVSNIAASTVARLKSTLEQLDGVALVTLVSAPTAAERSATFELQSGYVVLPHDELVKRCIDTAGPVQVRKADKYSVSLNLL